MSDSSSYGKQFLTADWRNLVMLNYAVEPEILRSHLPAGTELDFFEGSTYVSMVGFQFLKTRVFGIAVPGHRNFEEVNLRFYVRYKADGEWRRGVVFVKELVARAAIAWAARRMYGERYLAVPMAHRILRSNGGLPASAAYSWVYSGNPSHVSVRVSGEPKPMNPGSHEEFIAEHYWGYVRGRDGRTTEYRVEHPPWRIWRADGSSFECDVSGLYGGEFEGALSSAPVSAFLAEGSPVTVYLGRPITR